MGALAEIDQSTRAYLSGATDSIIRCRLFGHAWDPTHDGYIVDGRGRDKVFTQTVKCLRCKTTGVDRFDPGTLDRIKSRSYDYAEGYLLQQPKGGMSRRLVRQWVAEQTTGNRRRLRRVS